MRLSGTKTTAIHQYRGLGNQLWDLAGKRPSLDLRFADDKSLVDATTGTNLIDFTRASSGTYVDGDGLIKTATTDAPRFDHDPTTGESLGLLVEESRTNLVLQSQALTTSPWSDSAATTSLASAITDVFGGTSASFKLTEGNTNSAHFVDQGFTLAASTYYSVTAWFKQGSTNRDGRILLINTAVWDGAAAPRARIEFSTGTVQSPIGFTSTNLVSYSNGWYRFTGTALTSASGGSTALRLLVSDGGEGYQGDGSSFVYVGPCQLEEASFPTSYIPTEGSAVTRAADVASISGTNFSSWYNASEGTVFVDSYRSTLSLDPIRIFEFEDGSGNRYELIADVAIRARSAIGGVITNIAPYSQGQGGAYAASFKAGNYAGAYKGEDPIVVTSIASVISANDVNLGSSGSSLFINGHLRRFTFWPQRLPDFTLSTITR